MLILVDLVQTHVFYLILLPTSIYIHVLIYRILIHHILLLVTITLFRELIIFLCQNHSVELWIIVTLLIIICFSDHVPLRLVLHIDVDYITVTSRPFSVKQAWYKATQCDIDTYKTRLDDILSHISLCDDMLDCDDQYCSVHKDEIVDLYKSVVNACIIASDHIPTTSPTTAKVMPGWNDGVKYLMRQYLGIISGKLMAALEQGI